MKKQLSFLFFSLVIAMGFFLTSHLHFSLTYDSDVHHYTIDTTGDTIGYQLSATTPQNTWYIGLDKALFAEGGKLAYAENICATWHSNEKNYTECLDTEHNDETSELYTFPVITSAQKNLAFDILADGESVKNIGDISLYSMNTLPTGKKLSFSLDTTRADSNIISRAEWGADETIRYVTHPRQQANYKAKLAYDARPKTATELKNIATNTAINAIIKKELGSDFETKSLIRTENGNTLVWPIQRVKRVNRIIVHHTSESLERNLPDEQMIRAIYSYHAITRGWGDIGYNYIIGQTGKVYEGRAGGPYVVGAHAGNNNIGSVGISVLWNYETGYLNAAQEASLKGFIGQMAQHYGIDVNSTVTGFKACSSALCFPLQVIKTPALLGHKDVGNTDCPGVNIYTLLPGFRRDLSNSGILPVFNPEQGYIEPKPANQEENLTPATSTTNTSISATPAPVAQINTAIKPTSAITTSAIPAQTSLSEATKQQLATTKYFGKKFRVKLSYPHNEISLSSYTDTVSMAFLDYVRKPIYPGNSITISPAANGKILLKIGDIPYTLSNFSLSAGVVRIDSWNRIPDWDTSRKYNDNLFRDTIEVFNENGKLVVVNHLPLEWYLKGLGEVSNSDLPEKIKTITVAARGYASFYMERENRKYNTNRYDGNDDPDSFQKYIGYSYETRSPNVSKMVDETAGEVIYYEGKLIKPWYFSSSSGRTLSYSEYCQKNNGKNCEEIPYLKNVDDPAGAGKTQSGHGVGISGIGATAFANQGWDYKKIIQYYLPGVEIRK